MSITSLSVFCGSQSGKDPLYCEHAKQIGIMLAQKNITLIYGGGNKGIMGTVANATMENGGRVIGIIPTILTGIEHQHFGITETFEVADMHTRKRMLYEKCDAALVLSGGVGTMDEFFEMITWNQLNIHNKKIFILNTAGFYDHLIAFLHTMEDDGFLYSKIVDNISIISSPEELEASLPSKGEF